MTRRRFLGAAAVLAAVVLLALAWSPSEVQAVNRSSSTLPTPMWSLRRVPHPIIERINQQRYESVLDPYMTHYGQSCFVVSRGGTVIAAHDPDVSLLPASTQKLMTAVTALKVLGPDFRYVTTAVAPAPPVNGVVDRLWVVGVGDPVLVTQPFAEPGITTPLEGLADSIVAAGVRHVTGGIVADDFRFDAQRYVPTWRDIYRLEFDSGPLGALTANHGIPLVGGKPVTVDDPGLYSVSQLTQLLAARGVTVGGSPSRGAAPASGATVGSVTSQPLSAIIAFMLKRSDNLTAELLTKEIGVRATGQGTTAAGTAAIVATVRGLGVPTNGVTMVDGSGLDRGNRMTCRTLAALVDPAGRPDLSTLVGLLPTARVGGRKVRAKSGSLDEVVGLAGFVDSADGTRFSFLANGGVSTHAVNDEAGFADALLKVVPASDDAVVGPVAASRTQSRF